MSVCQLAGADAGGEVFVRAEQNTSKRERERKGERERNSRDLSARVRQEEWGRVTGKAAGSAGVCTADTCLDSITGSGPLFPSDKNGKN